MNLTISSISMLNAVEAIDLVPTRAGIVPSEFIQVEKKKDKLYFSLAAEVYGKTFARCIRHDDGDFIFHIDRSSFVPFIQVSKDILNPPDYQIEFKKIKDGKTLTIKAGKRKVVLNAISFVSGYPSYAAEDGISIPLDDRQKHLLELASKYATSDSTLAYINCVMMREHTAVLASNRVSLFYGENKSLPTTVPLPLILLELLDHKAVKKIEVAKSAIKLKLNCGYLCQAINATAQKDFPVKHALKQFTKGKEYEHQFSVKAEPFIKAISRIALYVRGVINRELIIGLKCSKDEKKLKIYCTTPQGVFSELVNLAKPVKKDIVIKEWLLTSLLPLETYNENLGVLEVRYEDKSKTPYHIISKTAKIELMLSRRV